MKDASFSLASLQGRVGQEIGVSDWFTVEQSMIDSFASSTLDDQWIHIDVERARNESIFGTTVAHGFLVLSLIPYLRRSILFIPNNVGQVINYGADYLRFLNPVHAGVRIRLRISLSKFEPRGEGRVLLKARNTVEIETIATPALIVDMLTLIIYATQATGTDYKLGS